MEESVKLHYKGKEELLWSAVETLLHQEIVILKYLLIIDILYAVFMNHKCFKSNWSDNNLFDIY